MLILIVMYFHLLFVWSLLAIQSYSVQLYVAPKEHYVMRRAIRPARLSTTPGSLTNDGLYLTDGPPGIEMLKKCSDDPKSAARVDVVAETHNFINETHMAMEVQWVGDNGKTILALATSTFTLNTFAGPAKLAAPSRLWRSTDGRTFKDISKKIQNDLIYDDGGMLKSPVDQNYLLLIASSRKRLYTSTDSGNVFTMKDIEFVIHSIKFHSTDSQSLLALSIDGNLYYSKTFGLSWKLLMGISNKRVEKYDWADPDTFKYSAYATVVSTDVRAYVADFYRFDNLKDSGSYNYKVAFPGIHQFVAEGKFILLSSSKTHERFPETRGLNVSEDGGESWNMVRLPEAAQNDFYHVLDATEGTILIHVAIGRSTGQGLDVGTIYSSDGSGIYFVPVLNNHVYMSSVTDFYKVRSIRGTYITSVSTTRNASSLSDAIIQSMISYDRGGRWQLLDGPDEECRRLGEGNCYLHLHSYVSKYRHVNISHAVISHQNAPGLIVAHGNVGWHLKSSNIGVYISSDGGYIWKRVFNGAYHYAIANNGGLILAVPALGNGWVQARIYYSFDWGDCWHWTTFISDRFQFTGLLIEPTVSSTDAAVWGYTTDDRIWHVNTLDFTSILRRPCIEDDYEKFIPHLAGSSKGCLFGYKETFFRRIRNHLCYGGKQYEPQAANESCLCTMYDFECDYGYNYNRDGKCVQDLKATVTPSMYCHPKQTVYKKTLGYRPIPGDNCTKGAFSTYMSSETALCSSASGRKEEGGKASEPHKSNSDSNKAEGKKKGGGVNVAAAVLIPLALVVLAVLGYGFYKKCYLRQNSKFDYKYSMLAQEHEYSRKDLLTLDDDDDDV